MGTSGTKEQKSLRPHEKRTANTKSARSAVLMGATGATGKFILSYLLCSEEWCKITIIHRREVDLDEISKKSSITFTDQQKSKVTQHVVDMEKLCENEQAITKNVELFKNHDVTICVLGTTRAIAKSAENFRKVDHYMVRDGGILSQKAGIKHFSLLTAGGSNANLWTTDWKISHGLLYLKTKGDAEQSIIEQKFSKTSIFRPGWLDREGGGGAMKLSVRDLAAVIVYDAESEYKLNDQDAKEDAYDVIIYDSKDIDNMMVLARNNFNAACVAKEDDMVDGKENVEEEEKKADHEQVVDDKDKDKDKEEVVVDDKDKDKDKKEVVVDKVNDNEAVNDEDEDEDYVAIDKDEVDKV